MLSPDGAALTLLFCESPHRATKVFQANGEVLPYDAGAWFSHATAPVHDITSLAGVLEALATCPEVFVVRGRVRDDAPARILRRYKSKGGYEPQIEPCARPWVCLDYDTTTVPIDHGNPEAAVRQLLEGLPEGLREASCYWQLSSSAHKYSTFRGHIWFYLDRPYGDQEVKRALKPLGVDASLFQPVQPHYVANPIFETSGNDPILRRGGLLVGMSDTASIRGAGAGRLRELAEDLLAKEERSIREAIRAKKPRHDAINKSAYRLGQLCPHLLSEGEVFRRLYSAATDGEGALTPERATDEIRRALDDGKTKPELIGDDWKGLLSYGKGYQPASTTANVATILENDPRWAEVFAWNDRAASCWYRRAPPLGEISNRIRGDSKFADEDAIAVSQWLAREYEISIPSGTIQEAITKICKESPFDPVEEYLSSLEWDGVDRLPSIPSAIFGDVSTVAQECFQAWVISAVQRVFEPGCQSDHTLILEGPQGYRKSSFWEWLANGYYGQLKSDVTSKDSVMALQGSWIVDMSELGAMRRSDISAMKDFLTTRTDHVRLPYARNMVSLPRRCVIAATHNPSAEGYLKDTTGNRRIWPVEVNQMIPSDVLNEDFRDALWAEATHKYRAGQTAWSISDLAHQELELRHADRIEDAALEDPWMPAIRNYLGRTKPEDLTSSNILVCGVLLPLERIGHRERRRLWAVMLALGWRQKPGRYEHHARQWLPPEGHVVTPGQVVPLLPNGVVRTA